MTVLGRASRLLLGAALVWCVGAAVVAPELSALCAAAALVILATTLWKPMWGLALMAALAPAGALLAAAPARAAELFAWAFLAGWLLRVWRPLILTAWPRSVAIAAALYGGALVASWLSLTIAGAAGVPPFALPQFLFHALPGDYLVLSSPEAETWTLLQALTGIAVFVAAIGITRDDPRTVRSIGWALVGSMTVLAAATLIDVVRQWAGTGYGEWFLLRYLQGERYSLHLADVNAAGSLYVIAAVIVATYAWFHPERRLRWVAVAIVLLPAIWLTGSRSSYIALLVGLALLATLQRRVQLTRAQTIAGTALVLAMVGLAALLVDPQSDVRGSAGQSASLRSQFLQTSTRMFLSSPAFGVGVGRYFDRSAVFMTPELRVIYGNENAHNYFAQQFAELGLAGGLLFAWLVVTVVLNGWRWLRASAGDDVAIHGLFAATAAYVLTCVTGHPLLVPEAAIPFWAAFGGVAGVGGGDHTAPNTHRAIAALACAALLAEVAFSATAYARVGTPPPETGFHALEVGRDRVSFRWITRHAATYVPGGPGFLRLRIRVDERPLSRPFVVETAVAGRVVDRREFPAADEWMSYDIPVRETARMPFQRVDVRVNQAWTEEVRLGNRVARRPISLMVAAIDWIPLR